MTLTEIATAAAALRDQGTTPSGNTVLRWLKDRGERVSKRTVLKLLQQLPAAEREPIATAVPVVPDDGFDAEPWKRPYVRPEPPPPAPVVAKDPAMLAPW